MCQDCDSGMHVVLMSSEIIEVTKRNFLFAVEGMVKLHFTLRNQTGTRGDSRIERLAIRYRADVNFEQKSNDGACSSLMRFTNRKRLCCESVAVL